MNKLYVFILRGLPNFLWPLKVISFKFLLKKVGNNTKISYDSTFTSFKNIKIGNNVFIGKNFYCSVERSLLIKERVMFGANCSIIGGDHNFNDPTQNMRFTSKKGNNNDIIVEEDSWIGHGTVILKNAYISEGCIIGANSLVNCTLKPYSVYVGQPVKYIKPRFKTWADLSSYLMMMKNKFGFESRYSELELKNLYK